MNLQKWNFGQLLYDSGPLCGVGNTCINRVGIVQYVQLLVSCVGSRGLGLAALVSGVGRVSQWSAVVAIPS